MAPPVVSVPLAWCGMWVGGWLGLALVPFFVGACIAAGHRSRWLFLIYAAPAIAMLGLHAAVANQYTRYNLILIGAIFRWRSLDDRPHDSIFCATL